MDGATIRPLPNSELSKQKLLERKINPQLMKNEGQLVDEIFGS